MKVRVYRNLNNGMFSVIDCKTGRLAYHTNEIVLKDAVFRVQPGGLRMARMKMQRNVHAYIQGIAVEGQEWPVVLREIYYNPFTQETFTSGDIPVYTARTVYFKNNKCYI